MEVYTDHLDSSQHLTLRAFQDDGSRKSRNENGLSKLNSWIASMCHGSWIETIIIFLCGDYHAVANEAWEGKGAHIETNTFSLKTYHIEFQSCL